MTVCPVIGMSPGNSYFKDDVIKKLIDQVVSEFGKTAILVADIPAISTYIALGYPENRARRDKALPQGNNLKNKVQRAMVECGYTNAQVNIIDWETEVENNEEYREKYGSILNLYNSNESFMLEANETTKEVLEFSNKRISDIHEAVKVAVHYLLSEIAFMEFAPKYFSVDKAIYVYHKNWSVYEKYIAGQFDGVPKFWLGFKIIETN